MNHAALKKARLLMQQGRFKMAEQELRQTLGLYRSNAATRAMLSTCLLRQNLISEALHEAKSAIRMEPTNPNHYYVLSLIYLEQERYDKADRTIRMSLNHSAAHPDYLYVLGTIFFQQSEWEKALKICDMSLNIDAEHIDSLNLRARVLNRIGEYEASNHTFMLAFRSDPENPVTHANKGWAALEQKQFEAARDHFEFALGFNPELEFARSGLVESLKTKYSLYRWMMHANYWVNTCVDAIKIILVTGLVLVASHMPQLSPIYLSVLLFMWFPDVIFNVYLQKDERMRMVLSKRECLTSRVFGTIFLGGMLSLLSYCITKENILFSIGIVSLGMLFPLVSTLRTWTDYYARRIAFTVISGLLGVLAICSNFFGPEYPQVFEVIFFHAVLGYTWYENFSARQDKENE